jgi:hypothetical protein
MIYTTAYNNIASVRHPSKMASVERATEIFGYLPESQPMNPHLLIDEVELNFPTYIACIRDDTHWIAEVRLITAGFIERVGYGSGNNTEEGFLDAVQIAVLLFLREHNEPSRKQME